MQFHLYLPQMRIAPVDIVARAKAAEEAGFEGIALMDHLDPPNAEGQPMYEAFAIAGWIAAHTDTLLVSHLVLCDAFREVAMLARQVVTIDHLSGGRFELGLGTGSRPIEFERFGIRRDPVAARARRLGESIQVLRSLWSGEMFDFEGEFHQLMNARQMPRPLGHIPIVIGGVGSSTLPLVRSHADWWNMPSHELPRLDELRPDAGDARVSTLMMVGYISDASRRDETVATITRRFGPAGPGLLIGNAEECVHAIRTLEDSGVERCYVWFTDFAQPETLRSFGEEVIGATIQAMGSAIAPTATPPSMPPSVHRLTPLM